MYVKRSVESSTWINYVLPPPTSIPEDARWRLRNAFLFPYQNEPLYIKAQGRAVEHLAIPSR